eukprot:1542137-Amphidinium_carterae.1
MSRCTFGKPFGAYPKQIFCQVLGSVWTRCKGQSNQKVENNHLRKPSRFLGGQRSYRGGFGIVAWDCGDFGIRGEGTTCERMKNS